MSAVLAIFRIVVLVSSIQLVSWWFESNQYLGICSGMTVACIVKIQKENKNKNAIINSRYKTNVHYSSEQGGVFFVGFFFKFSCKLSV